ncbi:MAG TPA: hypothetical protein VK620_18435 [Bradyrhizobium sp.]|nr:hypothetical protein [Bradyrhizobium sp.]
MLDPAGVDGVRGVVRDLGLKVLTLQTIAGDDAPAIQKPIHTEQLWLIY